MPILHAQLQGQAQGPNGQSVPIPPPDALIQRGPIVQVTVSIAQNIAAQLVQQGTTVPAPVSGLGLIDTGATTTCIDDAAAQALGLPVVDVVQMTSASHAAIQQNVYPMQLDITGLPVPINAPRAMGANLSPQGLLVLIGRDLLRFCTLFYNGTTGEFTLSI